MHRGSPLIGIVTLALLAPLSAELLSAYLGDLGGGLGPLGFIAFLAPLYGGAGLLIREVSVRAGWGWRGRLGLGAAFGVAMTTVIDGSLFTPHADIAGWARIHGAAEWLGIGWFAAVTWVVGHMVMSIAVPLAIAEGLARRPGPWLGRIGLVIVSAAFLAVAVAVHLDTADEVHRSTTETVLSVLVVLAFVGLAVSPVGRPLAPTQHRIPSTAVAVAAGFAVLVITDVVPPGWFGVAFVLVVATLAVAAAVRSAASPDWNPRLTAALAFGALLGRTLTGGLQAADASADERTALLAQSAVYLVLVIALGVLLERRTRDVNRADRGAGRGTGHQGLGS